MSKGAATQETLLRIEVEIARPPTAKCRALLALLEDVLRRYPGRLRLTVYERGAPWPERPTYGFVAYSKSAEVPKLFVGGRLLAWKQVPALDDVLAAVERALRAG